VACRQGGISHTYKRSAFVTVACRLIGKSSVVLYFKSTSLGARTNNHPSRDTHEGLVRFRVRVAIAVAKPANESMRPVALSCRFALGLVCSAKSKTQRISRRVRARVCRRSWIFLASFFLPRVGPGIRRGLRRGGQHSGWLFLELGLLDQDCFLP
jgi:hypothetical protein